MFAQTTRLELAIVVAALLVLFLCHQPPKSGTAGLRTDAATAEQEPVQGTEDPALFQPLLTRGTVTPSDAATSYNGDLTPRPQPKRIWMLDARKCSGLNYKDVMYGEVSVRWIWDGQKLVPHKVLEVKEEGGTISIWPFEERNGVVLTEVPQPTQ